MSRSGLSGLQIALANLFFSLPESAGFLLAGGGALIAQGLCPAPPRTSTSSFAQALRAHRRIRDADFPDIGTPIEDIRSYFDAWADELDGR